VYANCRDVLDIRLYLTPAGYLASFRYPVVAPDSLETG